MSVMERQNDGGNGGGVFDYTEGPPPPPEVTAAGGGNSGAGHAARDRVQLTPHALLALGIVLGLGGVQQVAEQLVQPRSFSRSRSHMRTCCASASVQLSRM